MDATNPDIFETVKQNIRLQHLQQLQGLNLTAPLFETKPDSFDLWVKRTQDSMAQIHAGVAKGIFGGPNGSPIDFNNAFVAFMESMAMYLRDTTMVLKAVEAFRAEEFPLAHTLLVNSVSQIDQLADMWGMKFVMICDLVEKHPDGHPLMVGPFCGAFVSKDSKNPFMGVAFKGTGTAGEVINDLMAIATMQVPNEWLFGAKIAEGFYYPLFTTFQETIKPIVLVQQAIASISINWTEPAMLHVTGHSLGAAYASLCYGQLVYKGVGTTKALLGDLYTYGSPRVGRGQFAVDIKSNVQPPYGSVWRIVNQSDPVTKVPASLPWTKDSLVHLDTAYRIFPDHLPKKCDSEVGTHPTWPLLPLWLHQHMGGPYYDSLTYATTSKPPKPQNYSDLQMIVDALGGVSYFQDAASLYSELSVSTVNPQDFQKHSTAPVTAQSASQCVLGKVKVGSLVGEITAWGDLDEIVPHTTTTHYHSLQDLYGDDGQCGVLASKKSAKEFQILFVVGHTVVGVTIITTEVDVENANFRGKCTWEFADTVPIDEINEESLRTDTALETLFKDLA